MNCFKPKDICAAMQFKYKFCRNCVSYKINWNTLLQLVECSIIQRAELLNINHHLYPAELIYDKNNESVCTAFKKLEVV